MDISTVMAPRVLVGKTALVTGAGQGNGKAIAKGLALAGAYVLVTDLNGTNAESVARDIKAEGGEATAFQMDVTSKDACEALAAQVGTLDVLVNNAGIVIRSDLDNPEVAHNLEKTMQVNLMGTFYPIMAWLKALRESKGVIINIASIASWTGIPNIVGYSPSKGAVKMLTQTLAVELAKDGIRVNAVAPGVIETRMSAPTRETPERLRTFMLRTPMGRVGQPEELVGPVVFLASDMAGYVTGITLPVDGGYMAT